MDLTGLIPGYQDLSIGLLRLLRTLPNFFAYLGLPMIQPMSWTQQQLYNTKRLQKSDKMYLEKEGAIIKEKYFFSDIHKRNWG